MVAGPVQTDLAPYTTKAITERVVNFDDIVPCVTMSAHMPPATVVVKRAADAGALGGSG